MDSQTICALNKNNRLAGNHSQENEEDMGKTMSIIAAAARPRILTGNGSPAVIQLFENNQVT